MAFVFGVVLPWAVLAVGCWIGYHLIRQNGRILLQLEALQQQIAPLVALAAQARAAPAGARGAQAAVPQGLPIGSEAPDFELASLSGKRVSLAAYRGKKTLLVFFNPGCGYCAQMAPDLAALPVDGADGRPIPLLITAGDREANRQMVEANRIRALVLLQKANEVAERYKAAGTPTGYLIDEQGRIASELAVGAQALLALVRATSDRADTASADETLTFGAANGSGNGNRNGHKTYQGNRSLADSHIKRDGLAAGTPAPDFRLERVDGGELSLAEYRGRKVLLVFSDPQCGPCERLVPKLEDLHRQQTHLEVVMVSRGDAEENRKKVTQFGLTFPVVLQKQWEVSRSYAMFGTPVGYLVDEAGVLASDVAMGEAAILDAASRVTSSLSTTNREGVQLA
jgi:peroxiredoxin